MNALSLLPVMALALCAGVAHAQASSYPNRPIHMIVGFPPGGGTDVVARIIAPKLAENLGQPVLIENRPAATGTVAAGIVARSPADGYTLMMGHVSVNAIAPSLFPTLSYDVIKDFAPITLTASVPHFIVVHPSLPANSEKALIAYAKAHPGELSSPLQAMAARRISPARCLTRWPASTWCTCRTRARVSRCRTCSPASIKLRSIRCRRRRPTCAPADCGRLRSPARCA